jgi:uncharacterized protein YjbI with pentapeptide repeats
MENQFDAFLSRISLGSSQVELDNVLVEPQPAASENLEKLQVQIEGIYTAVSDDFLELAQLAELNPLKDFTGANLLAAELSGSSLGMANLYQANLRRPI